MNEDRYIYRVLCGEDEEIARIYIEDTLNPYGDIEGTHHINSWINHIARENEQLKKRNKYLLKIIFALKLHNHYYKAIISDCQTESKKL